MKIEKSKWVLSTFLCLAPILAGIYYYNDLPDMMVTHWGMNNEPNGWMSKPVAVLGLPALTAVLQLICLWSTRFLKEQKQQPKIMTDLVIWICPVISILASGLTISFGLGYDAPIEETIVPLVGLLFIVVGNYLPKVTMNSYLGIRIPWVYTSEENWNRTHRLGGKVWVICGFLFLLAGFFHWMWVVLAAIAAMILIPVVYSYLLYKKGI